jgi:hypothetical protein
LFGAWPWLGLAWATAFLSKMNNWKYIKWSCL